jgi:glycosyltransferase involved in cell wall biosynthesis
MKTILIDLGLITNTKRGMGVYIFNILRNLPDIPLNFNLIFIVSKNHSKLDINDLESKYKNNKSIKFFYSPFHSIITEQLIIPLYMIFIKSSILLSSGDSAPLFVNKNKIILLLHDLYFFKGVELYKIKKIPLKKRIGQFYRRLCIRRFLNHQNISIITVSFFMQKEISIFFKIPINRIIVVPNGIYFENHILLDNCLEKKGLTLITGTDPQKNLDNFITSINVLDPLVISKIGEINIIGVKSKNYIINLNNQELKINFLGYLPHKNVLEILKKTEYFVLPSLHESFGIPGLEALIHGCKVAASETGALKEVLGNCAIYFNPYDIYSIAQAITKMVNEPQQFNSTIKEQISEYDWRNSSFKLLNFFKTR